MRLLTVHLIRSGSDETSDDTFMFMTVPDIPDLVKVRAEFSGTGTVRPGGFSNTFVLSRNGAYEYVMTLVGSLIRDDDPFEKLQVSSAIFPTVLYRVEYLHDDDVRTAIQNIVYSTFNTSIS